MDKDKFTKKKNFWGTTVYYDKHGKEIGHEETSWFGKSGVYKDGRRVADVETDADGNKELVFKPRSIFGSSKKLTDKNSVSDWGLCEYCGEFHSGVNSGLDNCDR